ncbi:MAG: hypothetical protein WC391_02255 [Methanoregula sp.]
MDSKPFLIWAGPSRTRIKETGLNFLKFLPMEVLSVDISRFRDLLLSKNVYHVRKNFTKGGVMESTKKLLH